MGEWIVKKPPIGNPEDVPDRRMEINGSREKKTRSRTFRPVWMGIHRCRRGKFGGVYSGRLFVCPVIGGRLMVPGWIRWMRMLRMGLDWRWRYFCVVVCALVQAWQRRADRRRRFQSRMMAGPCCSRNGNTWHNNTMDRRL